MSVVDQFDKDSESLAKTLRDSVQPVYKPY